MKTVEEKSMSKVEKDTFKIEEDDNSITIKFGKSENYEEMEREGHDDKEDKDMHDDDKQEKDMHDDKESKGAHEDEEKKDYHMDKDKEKSMHEDDEEDKEKDRSSNFERLFRSAFLNKRKVDDEKEQQNFLLCQMNSSRKRFWN